MREFRLATASLTAGAAALTLLGACGTTGTPADATPASSGPGPAATVDPRGQLASRAAAAKDRRYVAGYTLSQPKQPLRSVLVTVANDGSWRVDIQGGALAGTADVSIASRPEGMYQCSLGASAACVRVADPGAKLPAAIDPRTEYPFTSWLDVFTDRQASLSVMPANPLAGQTGTCFGVEAAVTALQPPVDAGVFCFAADGTPTGVQLPYATLTIAGAPQAAPATVVLPGPVTAGVQPLTTDAPPPPSPSPSVPVSPSHV